MHNKDKSSPKINIVLRYGMFFVSIALGISFMRSVIRTSKANEKLKQVKQEVFDIKVENEAKKQQINWQKTDIFIEKQAREKLQLAKEGEIVIVLPDVDKLAKIAPVEESEELSLPAPNWQKWAEIFGF